MFELRLLGYSQRSIATNKKLFIRQTKELDHNSSSRRSFKTLTSALCIIFQNSEFSDARDVQIQPRANVLRLGGHIKMQKTWFFKIVAARKARSKETANCPFPKSRPPARNINERENRDLPSCWPPDYLVCVTENPFQVGNLGGQSWLRNASRLPGQKFPATALQKFSGEA